MASPPHAVVIPFPAQGHIIPCMELSYRLVEYGFRITFVNTEFNHERVAAALSRSEASADAAEGIHTVVFPDGLAPGEDRNNLGKLVAGFLTTMPPRLEELIAGSESQGSKIKWIIADENMAWAFAVAKKMGVKAICYWMASAAMLATMMRIPKLIQDGVLDANGLPTRDEKFQLCPGMPVNRTTEFAWNCAGDSEGQKIIFQSVVNNNLLLELVEFMICNTSDAIESPVLAMSWRPEMLSIGPLISAERFSRPLGHFWPEDMTCLEWLDEQPPNSVVYAAFGSFTVFGQDQFKELALGLELSSRPFLWVVRPDLAEETDIDWMESFRARINGRGKMVEWSPQKRVLAHPSIACFVTHCGWSSTLEGVWNGVPCLCRPYFTDQFLNQSYICDVWKVGLRLDQDEVGGIISRETIKEKLEELLGDEGIKTKALELKELTQKSTRVGGSSDENLMRVVQAMRE